MNKKIEDMCIMRYSDGRPSVAGSVMFYVMCGAFICVMVGALALAIMLPLSIIWL